MPPLDDYSESAQPSVEELIATGRRNLLCLEFASAVQCFQRACQILAEENGDLHDTLAVPNLLYGTALLELSRCETKILGETLQKLGSPEETAQSDAETDLETLEGDNNVMQPAAGLEVDGNPPNEVGKSLVETSVDHSNDNAEDSVDPKQGCCEADESDDVSTLQLAWEVVEVAKTLFMRHKDGDSQLKVADCLEKLAEIGREIEDHKQATNDLLECLELRKKYAPENQRLIAETHFQLAVTYSLENNFNLSDASFIQALQHLENHKSKLLALLDVHSRESDSDKCELHRLEVELKEVSGLIAEVGERQKENAESMQQTGTDIPSVEKVQEKTLPVDDISHLIKKKRPVVDAPKADDEQASKKAKLDAVSVSTPKPG